MSREIENEIKHDPEACQALILPVKDALDVLGTKWKLQIIIALRQGVKRFSEISKSIPGISDRMLSKELKDLEMHRLVERKVIDAFPPVVEYSITQHGETLDGVIHALRDWGQYHREVIIYS